MEIAFYQKCVGPRPLLRTCRRWPPVCVAALVSLIKLTFSHDTSPHCTRFCSLLKTERRESDVRCCWPGDTRATTSRYTSSTAGDPHAETNNPQLAKSSSAEPRMSEHWRGEKWISLREKQSQVEAESVSGFFCRSIKLQSSAHRLNHFQCAGALPGDWLRGGLWCPIPVCQTCVCSSTAAQPINSPFSSLRAKISLWNHVILHCGTFKYTYE